MADKGPGWKDKLVSPDEVLEKIEPGSNVFLGTGVAEPRTMVRRLMESRAGNLQDLELMQLVSLGDAISTEDLYSRKFRLKTFFAGWVASDAITTGRVDLVPSRFSRIPKLVENGYFRIDVALVQISPPDENGYASLGAVVDIARQAMEQATLVVGEINTEVPRTLGDTFVHVRDFDLLVESSEDLIYFPRWPVDDVFDRVARNVASVIPDGSCITFSIGPLYDALSRHLTRKKDLGVHSAFLTDAVMDLIESGAVSNRRKGFFRGKSLASYALGTPKLMKWLHRNPLVELQGIDVVYYPQNIARNDRFCAIVPARRADITGGVALHAGKGNVAAGPGDVLDFCEGAKLSTGGQAIFALPSRNRKGEPNIRLSVDGEPGEVPIKESLDMIVTEYGVAPMTGRTVRERAQAIIDIAHPDDRADLVKQAKEAKVLYPDQIYLAESGKLYPSEIAETHEFKGDVEVQFRPIKPSDEEPMRRLFYRFSDQAVYYRYFSPIKTMPHSKMQEYVNIDYQKTMSIVGVTIRPTGKHHIICEARYVSSADRPYADIAFVVDDEYQGRGIGTYLFLMLIRLARQRGIRGFTADVLATNKPMMKVFERSPYPIKATVDAGVYELKIPFEEAPQGGGITYVRPGHTANR